METDQHYRSIIKGAAWRIIGALDTTFPPVYTRSVDKARQIGGIEVFTKIFLFWLHERIWIRQHFGTLEKELSGKVTRYEKHYRSIIKGASWRIIGSIDTFCIALFVNPVAEHATLTAFYIAATEVITKTGLFWLHERLWMRVQCGKALPVTEGLKKWMTASKPKVLPKSPMGKTIHYTLSGIEELKVYTTGGNFTLK